jgi:hypothetical protein
MNVAKGLRRLGDPTGTTELQWCDAMKSRPQMISAVPHGGRLLQWRSGRYTIQRVAVLFDAQHRFVRITTRYQC